MKRLHPMYDAHLHLQDARFDTCREAVICTAVAAGVTAGCCCGTSATDWQTVSRVCSVHTPTSHSALRSPHSALTLLPAFGVHPWHAGVQPADWLARLEDFLLQHPDAPVGEIGLDGLRDDPPRSVQRQVLCAQLELAVRLQRPVVFHGARAWGELLSTLRPFAARLPGFVLHAFGGSADIQHDALALGAHLSFAGNACNPAAKHLRAAVSATPANRLLIETDAPDMPPKIQNHEGSAFGVQGPTVSQIPSTLNHPANLIYIAQIVAELRGVSAEEIAILTTANAQQVYQYR